MWLFGTRDHFIVLINSSRTAIEMNRKWKIQIKHLLGTGISFSLICNPHEVRSVLRYKQLLIFIKKISNENMHNVNENVQIFFLLTRWLGILMKAFQYVTKYYNKLKIIHIICYCCKPQNRWNHKSTTLSGTNLRSLQLREVKK